MLLEEFENVAGVIEPTNRLQDQDESCETIILSFNGEIVNRLSETGTVRDGGHLKSLNGKQPWYLYEQGENKIAVMLALIGAPVIVGQLEELAADKIILSESALRDEGTSYHYAQASDEIAYEEALLTKMENIFDKHGIEHIRSKSWTTDAFYRETPAKVKHRLKAGAQVVDMETSAIMAWSQFRKKKVYQFFYTANYVDHHSQTWDARREERTADPMTFFDIALTIAEGIRND